MDGILRAPEEAVRAHPPVYQNLEYLSWKQLQSAGDKFKSVPGSRLSSASTEPPLLTIGQSIFHDDTYGRQKEKDPSFSPRKMVSDTNLSTPSLRKQIRAFLATDVVGYPQKTGNVAGTRGPNYGVQARPMPPVGPRGESFGAYLEAYNHPQSIPIPPPPGYPQPMGVQPPGYGNPYAYPQVIQPVYMPVLMPQMYPSMSYPQMPDPNGEYLTGRIKFFDETQNYGFFILDCDGTDLFVHYDDLLKSGITKEFIRVAIDSNLSFGFKRMGYYGKYKLSYKAVDVQLLEESM